MSVNGNKTLSGCELSVTAIIFEDFFFRTLLETEMKVKTLNLSKLLKAARQHLFVKNRMKIT